MKRREMLKAVSVAIAGAVSATALAADQSHQHDHVHSAKGHGGVIAASADCLKTGEVCLAHCIQLLGKGDTELAACAASVNEMMPICDALLRLVSQGSRYLPALAKVAADTCASCEKECRKHEKKHAECKACADACATCLKECQNLAA